MYRYIHNKERYIDRGGSLYSAIGNAFGMHNFPHL